QRAGQSRRPPLRPSGPESRGADPFESGRRGDRLPLAPHAPESSALPGRLQRGAGGQGRLRGPVLPRPAHRALHRKESAGRGEEVAGRADEVPEGRPDTAGEEMNAAESGGPVSEQTRTATRQCTPMTSSSNWSPSAGLTDVADLANQRCHTSKTLD